MRFLFWNVHKHNLSAMIGRLVVACDSDVVVLAENAGPPAMLAGVMGAAYREVSTPGCRLDLLTRLPPDRLRPISVAREFVICRLVTPEQGIVLLTAVHLSSRLRYSPATQRRIAGDLAEVLRFERKHKTDRSLVIGDFNMNPFDPGMIELDALHAVCSRQVAARVRSRTWEDKDYPILVRPSLVHLLRPDSVSVMTSNGVDTFVSTDEIPLKERVSDHLPLHVDMALS